MPKPDGTLYRWELAELRNARASYESAVRRHQMHRNSSSAHHYEALEKIAFARMLQVQTKYAGCREGKYLL